MAFIFPGSYSRLWKTDNVQKIHTVLTRLANINKTVIIVQLQIIIASTKMRYYDRVHKRSNSHDKFSCSVTVVHQEIGILQSIVIRQVIRDLDIHIYKGTSILTKNTVIEKSVVVADIILVKTIGIEMIVKILFHGVTKVRKGIDCRNRREDRRIGIDSDDSFDQKIFWLSKVDCDSHRVLSIHFLDCILKWDLH